MESTNVDSRLANRFGKALARNRQTMGISQQALALECDLDRTYISLLERGKRQPSLSTIFVLARALSIRPSELIRETEEQR